MSDLPPSTSPTPEPDAAPALQPAASEPNSGTSGISRSSAAKAHRPIRRSTIPEYTDHSRRDTIVALLCGMGVLLFLGVGFFMLQGLKTAPVGNKLDGVIVDKYATGVVEKEISVGGKKGLESEETESGFYFKIKVPSEQDRIFEVPVPEALYEARKVGDKQSFIKPPSEQK